MDAEMNTPSSAATAGRARPVPLDVKNTIDRSSSNNNKTYMQQYYQQFKDKIKAHNTERIPCAICGKLISRHLMRKHESPPRLLHLIVYLG
ncbi:hypothetical protein SAMD00019534_078270 [Acytostelium subglobosum LB1]|uniref:hypothetical protein n=1 Tax=Acytostelium subglobosum LB1 TaxID=1410327 RepID=UPI00064493DB|nr:hypothetical protein SAMD00019534_078270 [Acytostelium subglobosum LB1]GAM24652.1 hypothetical protein SAMD00019534_078270 [Acytostelium subglobosum LB1]|eukprot:XP_012752321.1 hypothetical protein SAMD00019534_078270 [Acytostelium subglobosum LB1]